jgi:hypothetical protein
MEKEFWKGQNYLNTELIVDWEVIQKKFRLEKYGTEDWFIEKPEKEIFFSPTKNEVITELISEYKPGKIKAQSRACVLRKPAVKLCFLCHKLYLFKNQEA